MQLRYLHRGTWSVLAEVDSAGTCAVEAQLEELAQDGKTKATAAGFLVQWDRIPIVGPMGLGTGFYHKVDDENDIYEFIKRDHRLLCFEAAGRIVVCSHVIRKTGRKTPGKEKKKAAAIRAAYFLAEAQGSIEILEE